MDTNQGLGFEEDSDVSRRVEEREKGKGLEEGQLGGVIWFDVSSLGFMLIRIQA